MRVSSRRRWPCRSGPLAEGVRRSTAMGPVVFEQHEVRVVRGAHRMRLVTVGHDANALQLGYLCGRVPAFEVRAVQGIGIDFLFVPDAGRKAAAQDDAVSGGKQVPPRAAGRADGSLGAPDELDGIPAHAPL